MKKYVIIAGVNGAGKSTLYQSLCSLKNMDRVNTEKLYVKQAAACLGKYGKQPV